MKKYYSVSFGDAILIGLMLGTSKTIDVEPIVHESKCESAVEAFMEYNDLSGGRKKLIELCSEAIGSYPFVIKDILFVPDVFGDGNMHCFIPEAEWEKYSKNFAKLMKDTFVKKLPMEQNIL